MDRVKRKRSFVHVQHLRIHFILRMRKASPGPLLSIDNSVVSNDSSSGQRRL